MKSGPIILVEDDIDDKETFEAITKDLRIPNKLIWFENSLHCWDYLKTTSDSPFLIFCDVNLPKQNGIDFKRQIDEDRQLRKKSIPFVFYSTSTNQKDVDEAYMQMTVQGFFQKSSTYEQAQNDIRLIIDYWKLCKHPNAAI